MKAKINKLKIEKNFYKEKVAQLGQLDDSLFKKVNFSTGNLHSNGKRLTQTSCEVGMSSISPAQVNLKIMPVDEPGQRSLEQSIIHCKSDSTQSLVLSDIKNLI